MNRDILESDVHMRQQYVKYCSGDTYFFDIHRVTLESAVHVPHRNHRISANLIPKSSNLGKCCSGDTCIFDTNHVVLESVVHM